MQRKLEHAKRLYLEGIRDGRPVEAINAYTGDRYTQHSTGVADGREGFIAFFTDFIARNPERHIEIKRGWVDGQYVFLHAYQDVGSAQWVTTDFFDTDADDKIIEHWDVISAFTGPGPSGLTQLDGPTDVLDHDLTEANKETVRTMLECAKMAGARPTEAGLAAFFSRAYREHDPTVADGFAALAERLQDPQRSLQYQELVLCVGEGNFVATLCKATREGQALCQADVYRLEGGKIVEHWENAEPVPENDVNGGKF